MLPRLGDYVHDLIRSFDETLAFEMSGEHIELNEVKGAKWNENLTAKHPNKRKEEQRAADKSIFALTPCDKAIHDQTSGNSRPLKHCTWFFEGSKEQIFRFSVVDDIDPEARKQNVLVEKSEGR